MDDQFWLFLIFIGGGALFVAGVIFHKYVVSETAAIKEHVTAEVAEVRADLAAGLSKVAGKL